jgi:hypothetical protein
MTYTSKAVGAILMPYVRIGGLLTFPPPLLARVQTDGSYTRKVGGARIAYVLHTANGKATYADTDTIKALNSTETEWASVAFGLAATLEKSETAVGIENDCLGVIHGLMYPANPLKHAYAQHWRKTILALAAQTHWTGVRWIPREYNDADGVMRNVK